MTENHVPCLISPLLAFGFFLSSCGPGPPTTVPDAPPPWQEVSGPNDGSSGQHGLESPTLGNPAPPRTSWRERFSARPSITKQPSYSSVKANYHITAYASVWVLVQDKRGNELEWISMKSGDEVPIMHRGPLTITCSSGNSVKITDKTGKKVDVVTNSNGISIVRLP